MNKLRNALAVAVLAALAAASSAQAADLIPVNLDGANEGYNDNTPATPVGGNYGTTKGEQRRIVAQYAAAMWGSVLKSDQPIYIAAQFNPLGANVLGSAGAVTVHANFGNAPVANVWYPAALADAISGIDLAPTSYDISSQFSSDFSFYYGLDGKTPAGQINFLDVVMHEFGHGLGFQNFETEATGAFLSGRADIYSVYTYDNTTGKFWTAMTQAERVTSALNYGNVVFTGANATAGAKLLLDDRKDFRVTAPAPVAGNYAIGSVTFGPLISTTNFNGQVVLGTDSVGTPGDGCEAITSNVAGKIALIDRGVCTIAIKTKNAQDAGAIGVIIANNAAANPPPNFSGVDPTITIPTIVVTQAAGTSFKANLPMTVTYVVDATKWQGADDLGRPPPPAHAPRRFLAPLMREHVLTADDLIYPVFVHELPGRAGFSWRWRRCRAWSACRSTNCCACRPNRRWNCGRAGAGTCSRCRAVAKIAGRRASPGTTTAWPSARSAR
jgi:hypothetical protein